MAPKFALFTKGSKLPLNKGFKKYVWVTIVLRSTLDLASDQVQRLIVAINLHSRFELEENNFVSRIVAVFKTWVRSLVPEMKRQTTEWRTPN